NDAEATRAGRGEPSPLLVVVRAADGVPGNGGARWRLGGHSYCMAWPAFANASPSSPRRGAANRQPDHALAGPILLRASTRTRPRSSPIFTRRPRRALLVLEGHPVSLPARHSTPRRP